MHWRTILISKPCKLSLHQRQLMVEGEDCVQVPIEDINALILETPQALITTAVLSALAEMRVVVITCDEKHLPNGALMPFLPHSRQLLILHRQLSARQPLQKRIWQLIVQAKIRNQAQCLDLALAEGGDYLRTLANEVLSGDSGNIEGVAAQFYFPALMGNGFNRGLDIWHNAAFNYGFAVLRGCLARTLASYGFIPAKGLHHCNELNPFNLADDLIEPFRPFVEKMVQSFSPTIAGTGLLPSDKKMLVGILYQEVLMPIGAEKSARPQGKMTILSAIDLCVESLSRALMKGEAALIALPQFIET